MRPLLQGLSVASILFCGAIFGFFYAWLCSTMWGLDEADPRVAIEAMQAMNASVRNAVFFPAFFLTPAVLALTAGTAMRAGARMAAAWFGTAAIVYLISGLVLTMLVNVPMNEALATSAVPASIEEAEDLWRSYSQPWQFWNLVRTIGSGIALACASMGLASLPQR